MEDKKFERPTVQIQQVTDGYLIFKTGQTEEIYVEKDLSKSLDRAKTLFKK